MSFSSGSSKKMFNFARMNTARFLGFKFVRQQMGSLRNLSHFSQSNGIKIVQQMTEDHKAFNNVYPSVVQTILKEDDIKLGAVKENFNEALEYNVRDGRNRRGMAAVMVYKLLNNPQSITEEKWHLVQAMGWCIEMLHTFLNVIDDALDNSPTRHGKPSWSRKKGEANAMFDAILIKAALYKLLNELYKDQPYYVNIMELFYEVSWKSVCGASLDLLSSLNKDTQNFEKITEESYATLVDYKTGYLTFYLPTFAAFYMSGITDSKTLEQTKAILIQLGHYWQAKNDYEDVFEDSSNTGKVGTDIQEGRCSWLLVNALKMCNEKQLQLLKENYGYDDPTKIQRIVDLYQELEISKMYTNYSGEMGNRIMEAVDKSRVTLPKSIFEFLMAWLIEQKY